MVGYSTRSNPQQPGPQRRASPLKLADTCQGLAEDLRRQVLSEMPVAHTLRDIGVHTVKILLVKIGKPRRIALRRLHQQPFISVLAHRRFRALDSVIRREGRKVTARASIL